MQGYTRGLMALWVGSMVIGTMPVLGQAKEQAADPAIQAELRYFVPTIHGSIGGTDYFSQRTYENKLDLEHDLGLKDAQAPEVKVSGKHWAVDFMRLKSKKDGYRLQAPITHKEHTYKGNLDTDMDMTYLTVDWRQTMGTSEPVNTWWSLGAKYIRLHARSTGINAYDRPESDEDSASGIIPSVGIGGTWSLDRGSHWQATAAVSGMPLGHYGHAADMEAGISWLPSADWKVTAGWRMLDLQLHRDDKKASYQAKGPFFSLGYTF